MVGLYFFLFFLVKSSKKVCEKNDAASIKEGFSLFARAQNAAGDRETGAKIYII